MNVYDFDDTIYKGDSTFDFYKYSLKKKPSIIFSFPLISAIKFLLGLEKKVVWKEKFYRFFRRIDNMDLHVESFWKEHKKNIKEYYLLQQRESDVVISASPEFLLKPICDELGIEYLIASRVDKKTGKYSGENCWGEEKVRRFFEVFGNKKIDKFYSDSYSDTPLARISKEAYLVDGENLLNWEKWDKDLGKIY